ncbi:uncharacterized protein LOC111016255 [Momordica charantia]|uniref:Uncharacterized protein LOC111016255 n=1 Tax=Momordica charantia TaxID=3673 RepID=A0A6J1D0G9_MOMCH|nr:uncharacterized protein LOC111016255 [Momordica charantia]
MGYRLTSTKAISINLKVYAGGYQVIHFTAEMNLKSTTASATSSGFCSSSKSIPSLSCPNILSIPHCGIRQPGSGVVLSCLDCCLGNGSLYCFDYGVSSLVLLSRVRGGTCTTAKSDRSNKVLHRAMYLLLNGFGEYDVFANNCEDFGLYCKTGVLIRDNRGVGRSGQASSVFGAPMAVMFSSPLKLLMSSSSVGMAVTAAGWYNCIRYANDIGVRTDVIKVEVEDLPVYLNKSSSDQMEAKKMDDFERAFRASKQVTLKEGS